MASGETLPRFLPQEATVGPRAPAKGHDFPRGAGAPASVLPAGTSIWGRGGSGQGGGFFYEFPLVCLSFLCMLYPLPILPFSSLCHQKLPAALWARSAPPGGPTPVWMLDKRLWPFRDTGLASPGRRQSKPIGTPPACELGLRWAPGPAPCCPLSPGSPCSAFEPPLKCLFPREAPRCGESGELRSQCTAPPCRSAHREEVAVRLSSTSPPLQTDSLVRGEGSA